MVDFNQKWLLNRLNQWLSFSYLSCLLNKTFMRKILFNQLYLKEFKAKERNYDKLENLKEICLTIQEFEDKSLIEAKFKGDKEI